MKEYHCADGLEIIKEQESPFFATIRRDVKLPEWHKQDGEKATKGQPMIVDVVRCLEQPRRTIKAMSDVQRRLVRPVECQTVANTHASSFLGVGASRNPGEDESIVV